MSSGQDVGDVYAASMERIGAQEKDRARLGMEAIMWVAYSERPLSPEELCEALGVEIGSAGLDNDNVPSIRTILNCGLGLVTVDSSSCKVRLVHFTLQEHIQANPTLFRSPHSKIAEVCLTYLNFGCIRDLSPALRSPPPTTPFLGYASRYWGAHARRQTSASVISLAIKLLDGFDAHISCELLLRKEYLDSGLNSDQNSPIKCTALQAAAFLDVLEIMVSLLKINKWDINATGSFGITALMWATKMGHDAIVKVLLEQDEVNPDSADKSVRTPLSWAAGDGREKIVQMLLERNDANPDTPDEHGRTPLSWAAYKGREEIVRILLGRSDVDPGTEDEDGRTPLSWAAGSAIWSRTGGEGWERVSKMLLERDEVNPDGADKSGRTPLSWAAGDGGEKIVQMLLERNDVNPDAADEDGRTPLSWAAGPEVWTSETKEGHRRVIEILLGRNDVDPHSADKSGRTPMSWAAVSGSKMFVKILLEQSDVNPDSSDKSGRTPLSWAAATIEGEGPAKILLEQNNVDPDSTDNSGRTPLSWAARNGRGKILQMLLERNDVNPDAADEDGRTPLSWAAGPAIWTPETEEGFERAAKILTGRNYGNPWSASRFLCEWQRYREEGCEGIVKRLLERNEVDLDSTDKSGRTPLSWAAENGRQKIVEILSQRNDAHPHMVGPKSQTPFPCATGNGTGRVVQGQAESHGFLSSSGLGEELSGPFATNPSLYPEPPLKKIRRF